jgi:hypothetical protein
MYSSSLSLTFVVGKGNGQRHAPTTLPQERIVHNGGWASRPVWTDAEIYSTRRISLLRIERVKGTKEMLVYIVSDVRPFPLENSY